MAGIHWLTCPECSYRFYILEEEAGQGFEWFCPHCQHRFTEAEAASHAAKPRPDGVPEETPVEGR